MWRWPCIFVLLCASTARAELRPPNAPRCLEEEALSLAAAELLFEGVAPSDAALTLAVRRAGSDAVLVQALFAPEPSEARYQKWLLEALARADAPLACGVAQSDRGRLFLLAPRAGTLAPIRAKDRLVRGSLEQGFADPALVVIDGDGVLEHRALAPDELERGVELDRELPLPVRVQLIASGPAGPRPLAERVLGAIEPALAHATPPAPDLSPLHQLTVARGDADARGLREHKLLTQVAQAHATRACSEGRIAHELEPGADPKVRLRAVGVDARRVGETIARDRDASAALARMLESPSHRLTLLERSFTDVGLGEARDARGRVCLVVLVASWPRYVGR
jgi:hypothetical protein